MEHDIAITFDDGTYKVTVTIYEENEGVKIKIDWGNCPDDYHSRMVGMVNWFVKTITQ